MINDVIMYDLHAHIIPCVDDGAEDMQMALEMIATSREQGVRKIVATPHSGAFRFFARKIASNFQELKRKASEITPDVGLYYGAEVHVNRSIIDEVIVKLCCDNLPRMCETQYVLTEFSRFVTPFDALLCVNRLIEHGFIPIIAHVERYTFLNSDSDAIEGLVKAGCLNQINVYSVYNEYDGEIKLSARNLLNKKLVHFLGSDCHRTYHRPPSVADGIEYLYDNYETGYIDEISSGNARAYLGI